MTMAKLYAVRTKILSIEQRDKGIAFFYHHHHYHHHRHQGVASVGSIHHTDNNSTRQTFLHKINSLNSRHCNWYAPPCLPSHNIQVIESNAPYTKKYVCKVSFTIFTVQILSSTYLEKSKTERERILTNKFRDFSTPLSRFFTCHWTSRVCS
jgi:hypothetical protein